MRDSRILPSVGIAAGTVLVLAGCGSAATEPAVSLSRRVTLAAALGGSLNATWPLVPRICAT